MKLKNIFLMLAATTLTVACSDENENIRSNNDAVSFTVTQTTAATHSNAGEPRTAATGSITRDASTTEENYTGTGTPLPLFYGTPSAGNTQTATYSYNEGTGWTTDTPLYWQDLKPVGNNYAFTLVAPAALTDYTAGTVATDQSEKADYTATDLLMAYTTAKNSKENLEFSLKHTLAQVKVELVSGTEADKLTDQELATATLTIDGLHTNYTLSYNSPTTDAPATATAKTDVAAATGLKPYAPTPGTPEFFFIAPVQSIATGALTLHFTITVGGVSRSYTYTNNETAALVAGHTTLFTITASRTEVTAGTITVTDWQPTTPITGNVTMDITTGTPNDPTGTTANFTTMEIWKGQTTLGTTTAPTDAKTYTKNGEGVWSVTDGTPFYVDDITTADRFYTLATNTDGSNAITSPITNLSDILSAGPATINGTALALEHRHLMAQLTVTLAAGSGFSADLLTGATISTPMMKSEYTLGYSGTDNTVVATATSTASKSYSNLSDGTSYLVVPQTIGQDDATFTIKLKNGNTYTGTLNGDLKLEAGKNNTVTLTLNPTGIEASVSVTPWGTSEVASSSQLTIDGITGGDGSAVGETLTPAKDDALQILLSGSNSTSQDKTYTYTDGAWTSTEPIYWDSFGQSDTDIKVRALYTPKATPSEAGMHEKDILVTLDAPISFGAPLALSMKHAMAQLSIVVTPSGFESSEWSGATMLLKNIQKLGNIVLSDMTGSDAPASGNLFAGYSANGTANDLTTKATTTGSTITFTATIMPQAFAAGTELAVMSLNGNTYTLKVPTDASWVIKPGVTNTINVSLSKTGITVPSNGITIAPWGKNNTGDGGFELN